MHKANRTYHLFDIGGMYLGTFIGMQAVADKIGGTESAVRAAHKREGCLYGKYYVSANRNFDINNYKGKAYFNPILSRTVLMGKLGRELDSIKLHENIDEFFRSCDDLDLTDNCY